MSPARDPTKEKNLKLVIGIVRPEKANDVLEALYRAEVRGVSISQRSRATGVSSTGSRPTVARPSRSGWPTRCASRSRSATPFVQPTVNALSEGARTGEVGDGKIFVVPLERAVRIRTGETDETAVTPVGA